MSSGVAVLNNLNRPISFNGCVFTFGPLWGRKKDQAPALNLQVFREHVSRRGLRAAGQLIMTLLIPQPQEMSY